MKKFSNMLFILLLFIFFVIISLIVFNIYNAYSNTKDVIFLSEYIINNTDKLSKEKDIYVYKGDSENNYVLFNNMIWRIVKINNDNSIELILDDYINMLPKNLVSTFFENITNNLDLDYLTENNICKDTFDNNNITCNSLEKDKYISLLSVYDYMNSFRDNKTFITDDDEKIWLYNDNAHTNGDNLSSSNENNFYAIKPVITIKNKVIYKSGNGSKNSPYQIGDNNFSIGSKVKIYDDLYVVYDLSDDIKLMSLNVLEGIYKNKSLDYLNDKFLQNLSYKDILKDITVYTGDYFDNDTFVTKKIGIPCVLDIKFDSDIKDYYLGNSVNSYNLIYSNPVIYGDKNAIHHTRYVISLDKKEINNFVNKNNIYVYKEGAM